MALGGAILGGLAGFAGGASKARRENEAKIRQYENLKEQALIDQKNAFAQAKVAYENAASLLNTGQDTFAQGTSQANKMKVGFEQAQGQNMLGIGRSAVQFAGSAKGLIDYNYENMEGDLGQLMKNVNTQWDQTMTHRYSQIVDRETSLNDAETFGNLASYYGKEIKNIGKTSIWDELMAGFQYGIEGASAGALLPI